jgi:membrane-bound lytic murein transglycosylase D
MGNDRATSHFGRTPASVAGPRQSRPHRRAATNVCPPAEPRLWRVAVPVFLIAVAAHWATRSAWQEHSLAPLPWLSHVHAPWSSPQSTTEEGDDVVLAPLAEVEPLTAPASARGEFPVPGELRHAVAFWQQVFGVWGARQFAIHDRDHLGVVYDVVEIPAGPTYKLNAEQRLVLERHRNRIEAQLGELERRLKRRIALTGEQRKLHEVIKRGAGSQAVAGAADRLRTQRGMRESFRQGLEASSRYGALFRRVFREAGLPEDLAYLPHVESAFTATARSPAGAVGVWQFMPATGKRFLRMDDAVDERYDPVFATRGAARYLADAYAKLGNWPLAITSYNHGLAGVMRAKDLCGSDFACVLRRYESPSFGFASKNFYAEFLAVRGILYNLDSFFPEGLEQRSPPSLRRVRLVQPVPAHRLAAWHGIDTADLAAVNPAWTERAAKSQVELPAETDVWLPADRVKRVRRMDRHYTQPDAFIGRLTTTTQGEGS